jgi:sterol desaturase/sphingolipid hydroxylase (fatty acid hydroxylase superfamily)
MAIDPTVVAVPAYAATILAERRWLRRRAQVNGPSQADYETRDMVTSLTMGAVSLVAPLVAPRLMRPLVPGVGRLGRIAVGATVTLAAVAAVSDRLSRPVRETSADGGRSRWRHKVARAADHVASVAGVAAVAVGGATVAASWAWLTDAQRLWRHRVVPDLGTGPGAVVGAMVGWDLIYYWNHRFMHECRAMWAIHVVHHSSERYNLSTALRQPVADAVGVFVPYGLLSLLGIRPSLVASARAWNLLYQYWIHTDAIGTLGPAEQVLNTPSLHRVHHGSNQRYLDRNHGGILIVWDRLFGTHEIERPDEPVVFGLTSNINTFNPVRVASHEHAAMLTDVAASRRWRHRLGPVVRHPGWQPAA